jgi:protease I
MLLGGLISAGLARGCKLTSNHTIKDHVRNAGGDWIDREVVVDRNWVTSLQANDITAFNKAMLKLFSETSSMKTAG